MMKNTYKRGFTLIELLVVIAIIGVLAGVVMVALNSTRDKGSNASIKSTLNNIQKQAELYREHNGTVRGYSGMCTSVDTDNGTGYIATIFDDKIQTAITSIGGTATGNCLANATSWAVAVTLTNSGGQVYCVDSRLQSFTGAVTGGSANAAQEILDRVCDGNGT